MANQKSGSSSFFSVLIVSVLVLALSIFLYDQNVPSSISPQEVILPANQLYHYSEVSAPIYMTRHVEIFRNGTFSPESLALDRKGFLYTTQKDGTLRKLWNFRDGTYDYEIIARPASVNLTTDQKLPPLSYCNAERDTRQACGVPLGLRYYHEGDRDILLVIESYHGVIEVDLKDNSMKRLVTPDRSELKGDAKMFNSGLKVDGMIYFTISTKKFPYHAFELDSLELGPNGLLYSYNTKTNELKRLLDGLYFANGIEVSHDGQYLFVAETSRGRIRRYHLKTGKDDMLIEGLPCGPDNIKYSADGKKMWVACGMALDRTYGQLARLPAVRSFIGKLPTSVVSLIGGLRERIAMAFTVDQEKREIGTLLIDPKPSVYDLSEAFEWDEYVYFGFWNFNAIARVKPHPSHKLHA